MLFQKMADKAFQEHDLKLQITFFFTHLTSVKFRNNHTSKKIMTIINNFVFKNRKHITDVKCIENKKKQKKL